MPVKNGSFAYESLKFVATNPKARRAMFAHKWKLDNINSEGSKLPGLGGIGISFHGIAAALRTMAASSIP